MPWIKKWAIIIFLVKGFLAAHTASAQSVTWHKNRTRIDIPLSWEITGSDFVEGGIATQSESYREIWSLVCARGFRWTLSSPRGQVNVVPLGLPEKSGLPTMLAVTADHFATLLGVTDFDQQNWKERTEKGIHDLVFIALGSGANSTQEIPLYISKADYYSVILMLWR